MDFHLVGHLLVLPSGKILEITDQKYNVPGINNLYTTKNNKSVYKVTYIPYQHKLINELDPMDLSTEGSSEQEVNSLVPNLSLEDYFEELKQAKEDQDFEAEINDTSEMLIQTECGDTIVPRSLVDKTEKS